MFKTAKRFSPARFVVTGEARMFQAGPFDTETKANAEAHRMNNLPTTPAMKIEPGDVLANGWECAWRESLPNERFVSVGFHTEDGHYIERTFRPATALVLAGLN